MASEGGPPRRVVSGELLPPSLDGAHLPAAPLGVPFLAEARNWSERKQLESFERVVAAKNRLVALVNEQQQLLMALRRTREQSIAQIESLDDIREIERIKVRAELASARQGAQFESLRMSVEIEEMEVRLADAKRRRAAITTPPVEKERTPETPGERLAAALREINAMDRALREERERYIHGSGGEAALTDEDRQVLERMELYRRTAVEELYEGLR